ncbi:hypothetical protein TCAP_00487 [Tolypocladium capitatum]|uniref:Uncharacterized protein n=1 Tax=Tolypocladium capitatum TaxID=45235 RepID=A0A2K3QQ07_9HYPO|nr:hypothetical protein TCAP_00487 [Tolypocladium capitatum]
MMHFTLVSSLLATIASVGALAVPAPPNTTIPLPSNYTITIENADCPCLRSRLQYCSRFRREGVVDKHCYSISHYVETIRVFDPLISDLNPLLCKVYRGQECSGRSTEVTFRDNVLCREPKSNGKQLKYRSFSCHHEGW